MTRNFKNQHNNKRRRGGGVRQPVVALSAFALSFSLPAAYAQNPSSATTAHPLSTVRAHFDLFVGQDIPGPYTLSWTNLVVGGDEKIEVVVDGVTLKADDYTLDATKGLISFRKPLKKTSVSRVNYRFDSTIAKRNANVAAMPVTIPLLRVGPADMRLTALPGSADKSGSGSQTPLVWSIGGNSRFFNGGLSSQFYYAGANGSGMRVGYNLGNDKNGVEAKFLRAEERFATRVGKGFDLGDATQRWSVAARLRPANWFGASFSTGENDELTGKGNDTEQMVYGLSLGGVRSAPLLNWTRVEDGVHSEKTGETSVVTDKVDLAAGLGKNINLVAKGQRVATDLSDDKKDNQVGEAFLALTAASRNKARQASVALTASSKDDASVQEDRQAVSVKLQPSPSLVLSAEKKEQTIVPIQADGKEGDAQTSVVQSATAELIPLSGTKLIGSVQENAQNDAKTAVTNLNAEWKMGTALQVAGGVTNRSTDGEVKDTTSLNTTRARVALTPIRGLTLTGGYVENPEEKNGRVLDAMRQELGFNANLGALELGSGYSLTTLNGIELDGEEAESQYGEVSVTLGLRFSRWTRLSGNYRDALLYGSSFALGPAVAPRGIRAYGLNFTHDLGSTLSFTLGGQMTHNRDKAAERPDYKAEARLGAKF